MLMLIISGHDSGEVRGKPSPVSAHRGALPGPKNTYHPQEMGCGHTQNHRRATSSSLLPGEQDSHFALAITGAQSCRGREPGAMASCPPGAPSPQGV